MKRYDKPLFSKDTLLGKLGKYDSNFLISPYQRLFIGYSNNNQHRHIGSSGGIGSELACFVLEKGLVDLVIGVGFSKCDPTLPEYQVIDCQEDVDKLSGSKYVYMKFEPLAKLLALYNKKSVAVFVQPCFVKAIRSFQRNKYPNIKYVFSFFCGYNITYEGTEYLIRKTNFRKQEIDRMEYRWGEYPGGFMAKSKDGKIATFGKECYELIDLMFLRKGCKNCSYYMGEGADVALGDAWLKNLKQSSIVITRSDAGTKVIKDMCSARKITLYHLNKIDLIKMHYHNLRFKKYGLSSFLAFLHILLKSVLAKKFVPFKLMMLLSRVRRKFAIGVNVSLQEIRSDSSAINQNSER